MPFFINPDKRLNEKLANCNGNIFEIEKILDDYNHKKGEFE